MGFQPPPAPTLPQFRAGLAEKASLYRRVEARAAPRAITAADHRLILLLTSAALVEQPLAAVPVGTEIDLVQGGPGRIAISGGDGQVVLNARARTAGVGSTVTVLCVAAGVWSVRGALAALLGPSLQVLAPGAGVIGGAYARVGRALSYVGTGLREVAADTPRLDAGGLMLFEDDATTLTANPCGIVGLVEGSTTVVPSGWTIFFPAGVVRTMGRYTDNGRDYATIRYSGTASAPWNMNINAGALPVETGDTQAVRPGDTVTALYRLKVLAGAFPSGTNLRGRLSENAASAVQNLDAAISATSDWAEVAIQKTIAGPASTNITALFFPGVPAGPIDVTFVIVFDVKKTTQSSSPIHPPGGTAAISTRARDRLNYDLNSLGLDGDEGAVVLDVMLPGVARGERVLLQLDDGTDSNGLAITVRPEGLSPRARVTRAGITTYSADAGFLLVRTLTRVGLRWSRSLRRVDICVNGRPLQPIVTDVPLGLRTLRLANDAAGGAPGWMRCNAVQAINHCPSAAALRAACASITASLSDLPRETGNHAGAGVAMRDQPDRSAIHLMPPSGWVNDPCGMIYDPVAGLYHLTYQWGVATTDFPDALVIGQVYGQAVSRDLLRWEHKPIFLRPNWGNGDQHGIWSGGILRLASGRYVQFYTGRGSGTGGGEMYALTDDLYGITGRTLIAYLTVAQMSALSGLTVADARDVAPFIDPADGLVHMHIGVSLANTGGAVLEFKNATGDLSGAWSYVGRTIVAGQAGLPSPAEAVTNVYECPDGGPLGGKWFEVYSSATTVWSVVGPKSGGVMTIEQGQRYDYGSVVYATRTMPDADGRRVGIAWLKEDRGGNDSALQAEAGATGCLSLPHVLTLDAAGRMLQQFHPAVASLRARTVTPARVNGAVQVLPAARGEVVMVTAGAAVQVRLISGTADAVVLSYDPGATGFEARLTTRTRNVTAPLALGAGESLEVRAIWSGSVIEACWTRILADGTRAAGVWITGRQYGQSDDDARVILTNVSGATALTIHELAPISADRLTT